MHQSGCASGTEATLCIHSLKPIPQSREKSQLKVSSEVADEQLSLHPSSASKFHDSSF